MDSTDINKKIREYHEQLYANKFNNSDETNSFFKDTHYQNSLKKQIIWIALHLLKELNL